MSENLIIKMLCSKWFSDLYDSFCTIYYKSPVGKFIYGGRCDQFAIHNEESITNCSFDELWPIMSILFLKSHNN